MTPGEAPQLRMGEVARVYPQKRELGIAIKKGYHEAFRTLEWLDITLTDGESMRCRVSGCTVKNDEARVVLVPGVTRDNVSRMKKAKVLAPAGTMPSELTDLELGLLDGFAVFEESGARLGKVAAVFETKANGVLEVRTKNEKSLLLPVTAETIVGIDLEAGEMTVGDISPYVDENDEADDTRLA